MAIYKDEQRGTWYIDMRFRDSTGKVRSIKKRGFKSEQAAKREENRILREQKKEDLPVSSRPFKEIAYEYVDNKRYDLKETSYHNYKRMVDDFMPDTPIASLTSQRALQWRNKLSELRVNDHEYSSKTKNSIINLFIIILEYATSETEVVGMNSDRSDLLNFLLFTINIIIIPERKRRNISLYPKYDNAIVNKNKTIELLFLSADFPNLNKACKITAIITGLMPFIMPDISGNEPYDT